MTIQIYLLVAFLFGLFCIFAAGDRLNEDRLKYDVFFLVLSLMIVSIAWPISIIALFYKSAKYLIKGKEDGDEIH